MKTPLLYLLLANLLGAAPDWQPAKSPLMTEWGARVTPANAWREYPRPQLVRKDWQCLNGLWNYAVTGKDEPQPSQWSGRILVPFGLESALSGVGRLLEPAEALWYQNTVTVAGLKPGHRALLHFGGVDWDATVWVNGREVARHQGMCAPFTADITAALNGNLTADIVVKVLDPTTGVPHGKQSLKPEGCFYTRMSGIWQTVWLEIVPEAHITRVLAQQVATLDGVDVTVSASQPNLPVTVRLLDGRTEVATAKGLAGTPLALKVKRPKLWSPDSPFLYDLEVTLDGGESVASYTAIRWCAVQKDAAGINRLFLNGKPLFQLGPLDQGWWPDGLRTPPSDEATRWELGFLKKAGFNMLRKHITVENARYYRACDELGLLVWQDFPFPGSRKTEDGRANFQRESAEIVDSLKGFPCIVMWVVFNEMWEQFDAAGTKRMTEWTKSCDPRRIVSSTSGWMDYGDGEIVDAHRYPGPACPALDPQRAAVLGEFGGQGLTVPGHMWQEKSWGYKSSDSPEALAKRYAELIDELKPLVARGLSAAVYTQTSDVEIEKNGLLTYDRKVAKISCEQLATIHAPLYRAMPAPRVIAATAELAPVIWRHTTTAPPARWEQPGFNATAWTEAPAGFGAVTSKYTSGMTRIRSPWTTDDIWLRRSFDFSGASPRQPALVIYADNRAEVWLNGQRLADTTRNNAGSYTIIPLAALPLKAGSNTLAIHCQRQKQDNQYLDAGLIDLAP